MKSSLVDVSSNNNDPFWSTREISNRIEQIITPLDLPTKVNSQAMEGVGL